MRPDDYEFINGKNEHNILIEENRYLYGFMFSLVVGLFNFYNPDYNKELSKKAEDIEKRINIMIMHKNISDKLYRDFFTVYLQYPTLIITKLVHEKNTVGLDKLIERLKNLKQLLLLYIKDLSDEISKIIISQIDEEKKEAVKEYFKKKH